VNLTGRGQSRVSTFAQSVPRKTTERLVSAFDDTVGGAASESTRRKPGPLRPRPVTTTVPSEVLIALTR
jgi:hypothetical protein